MSFTRRHEGPELMDGENLPEADLFLNYRELHTINRLLGGYRITIRGLEKLSAGCQDLSILDLGCGGGDMLKVLASWGRRNNIKLHLTGIDLNPAAIAYSKENCAGYHEISFIRDDVFLHLKSGACYDVIMNTLFMHHLNDIQIISLLQLMKKQANRGFIINDLQRSKWAYFSIKILTRVFSRSYLVKHDAPLSVRRGFLEKEWWYLLSGALIATADISWQWAFRYLVVYQNLRAENNNIMKSPGN